MSHRDDVVGFLAFGPDDDHHTIIEMARGDKARFAIVEAVVQNRNRASGKHLAGAGEIQAAVLERQIALRRIER